MDVKFEKGKGSLYSVEHDFQSEKRLDNVSISNGIVWSQDGKRMYYIDTRHNRFNLFYSMQKQAIFNLKK